MIAALLLALFVSGAAATLGPRQVYDKARPYADRGEWLAAHRELEPALARWANSDDDGVWALRVLHAEVLCGLHQRDKAEALLARELPPRLRNSDTAVLWLRTRALARYLRRDYEKAKSLLIQAERLAQARHPRLLPYIYDLAADVSTDSGKADAELLGQKALDLARRQGNELYELRAINALVRVAVRDRRFDHAFRIGFPAARRMQALRLFTRAAKLEGNLAWALVELGDYDGAATVYERCYTTARRTGAANDIIPYVSWLGSIALVQGDHARATEYLDETLELARRAGNREAEGYALANLARVALETNRHEDARRYNAAALVAKRETQDDDAVQRSRVIEARIDAAMRQYAAAVEKLQDVLRQATRPDIRWEAQARLGEVFVKLKRRDDADREFRRAIETALEARAKIGGGELRFSFFALVDRMLDSYVDHLVDTKRDAEALEVTELIRGRTLEEGLGITMPNRKLDAPAIAKNAGATILCYSLGANRSHLWIVTPAGATRVTLPPESRIGAAIGAYQRELRGRNGTIERSGAAGAALFDMLVRPAATGRDATVVIVPDGRLYALNFETLVVAGPKPRYWIEDVVLKTAPSLALLAHGTPGRRSSSPATALIVGNAPARFGFPMLPHAAAEIGTVAKHFRSTTLSGSDATSARYRAAAPEAYDYLHFAAHGVASRSRPLDSAVILADGKLDARTIVEQELRARLVTISSCHGAGTRTYVGEGLVGLAWAFLRAGADEVIAALWEVDDAAALQVMDQLYAGIRAGREPAVALRDAKLRLVRSPNAYRKPDYWAPFVLYSR